MKHIRGVVLLAFAFTGIKIASAETAPLPSVPSPAAQSIVAPDSTPAGISLEQATKQVISSHYASRVLSAKTEEIDGRKVHVIKTLTLDGRIQQQTIAADTGVLLDIDNN